MATKKLTPKQAALIKSLDKAVDAGFEVDE
jgi:hypothetical protein